MDFDSAFTNFAGVIIILIGLVSLTESLLRVNFVGDSLPLVQGSFISLFTVSFGAVLLTEGASRAFTKFKDFCFEKVS